jgi:hypothetical protein
VCILSSASVGKRDGFMLISGIGVREKPAFVVP